MTEGRAVTITLDADTELALEAAVRAGEHASVEAAISAAVDEWWADRLTDQIGIDRLRKAIQEGVASGPAGDIEGVFARLLAKYESLAEARGE